MSMKDLAMYHAMALMYNAAYGKYISPYAEPNPTSLRLKDESVKLTGFTQVTGRRRWSKKQRKQQRKQQLKNRKK